MNNNERELWIMNDEGLYSWWKHSGLSKREFIQRNKAELDFLIGRAMAPPREKDWHDYCRV